MRTKTVLTILLTALIFLSAAVLGVSTVYRVSEVSVLSSVISQEAKTEAAELKNRLQTAYEKKSVFECNDEQAKAIVAEFAYFRYVSFQIDYPNRLVISVSEDEEMYAVKREDGGYYILGKEGTVLGIRDTSANRSDGAENIRITGVTATGEKGASISGDGALPALFELGEAISVRIPEIRRNVVSIEVLRPAATETEMQFVLTMREGVILYVHNPLSMTKEKTEKAMDEYFALASAQRLSGAIWIAENDGNVIAKYYENAYLPPSN